MNDNKPSVKEIARRAGVSIGTVDRVLHNRGSVAGETKARIESIVAELGYRPNVLARHLALNRDYSLRVLLPKAGQDSGYWRLCREGIEAAMEELGAYAVKVRIDEFDRYDRKAFRKLLDGLAKDPGDGLLMAPVHPEELLAALRRLPADLPYVFFDGTLPEASPYSSVGQDAIAAGRTAGRVLSMLAPGTPRLVAINAHAEDRHIRARIEGFKGYFKDHAGKGPKAPKVEVAEIEGLDGGSGSDSLLAGLFSSPTPPGGILVPNSSGHVVGEWLARHRKKGECALLTWDLVPANVACLKKGSVDCVISQKPFEQGRLGLSRILRKVVGEDPAPGRVDLPIEIWFKENLPA